MYDISKVIGLTKEMVLSFVSEYEIYKNYLGFEPVIGQIYASPLRNDTNPSFGIFKARNGSILYKDFGTNNTGDVFKLVKELCNFTYMHEAISEIYNSLIKGKSIKKITKKEIIPEKKSKKLGIKIMPFNEEGRKYWEQFGIDLITLKKFNVNQVKQVYINEEIKDRYKIGDPIFAYTVYDRLKIYKPLSKDFRFYTDCDSNYIQGWKQLDFKNDLLIITKSLKDVMLLYKLGYTSIAPNGEGYDFPKEMVNIIKKKFKKIILFYDKDKAGITNSVKLSIKYGFDYILIPNDYKEKDISDFYKEHGKLKTINILSKLIEHEKDISN
jgi:DNA primase